MAAFLLRVCCALALAPAASRAAPAAPAASRAAPAAPAAPHAHEGGGTVVWSRRGKIRLHCPVAGARLTNIDGRSLPPHMALVPEGGSAVGAPPSRWDVTWWRDDEKVSDHSDALVVQAKRGGTYRCAARSAAGLVLSTDQIVKLATMERQFAEEPSDTTAEEGQPVMLHCRMLSSPPANISWTRDSKPLLLDNRHYILRTGELLITDVTEADSGNYSCSASNWHLNRTRSTRTAVLSVTRGSVTLEPAFIRASSETKEVKAYFGEELLISCAVTGRPRPQVVWERARPGVLPSPIGYSQMLRIPAVMPKDSGVYSCRLAEYPQMTKTFEVSVLQPARIALAPESIYKPSAGTVRFNCSATGHPEPTITWYRNGQPLSLMGRVNVREMSGRNQVDRKELVIGGVQSSDSGVYQCFAQSPGTPVVTAWAVLGVAGGGLPEPTNVRCRPTDLYTVHLDWQGVTKPQNEQTATASNFTEALSVPTLYYTVSYVPEEGGLESIKVHSEHPSTPSMDIPVMPLTPHVVSVRAYYGKDASKYSEAIICQGQGVKVNIVGLSNGSISISWSEEANRLSTVKKWILQYRSIGEPTTYNVTLDGAVRSYLLPGVKSDDRYEVRLLASKTEEFLSQDLSALAWTPTHNAQAAELGGGCEQSEKSVVPNSLTASKIGAHALLVSWKCDACENSSCYYSFILCYKRFEPFNSLYGNREECKHSDTNELDVVGLDPGQQYQFKVQALVQGRAKGGEFSDVLLATTLVDESRRIKKVNHKYIGADGLYVWWSVVEPSDATATATATANANFNANANSTTYTVHYSQNLTRPLEEWMQKNVTGRTNVELYGLEPDLKTYVMVSCRSKAQEEHGPVMEVPPRFESRRIKSVHYTYMDADDLYVWWSVDEPYNSTANAAVADNATYTVHYSQNPTRPLDEWMQKVVTGQTSAGLYDLEPDLKTYVMVSWRSRFQEEHGPVMEVPPRIQPPKLGSYTLLGIIAGAVVCATCLLCCTVFCVWRRRKKSRGSGARARTTQSGAAREEDGAEMMVSRGIYVNGENGRGADEPLLNGHVHITENPALSKTTPNGRYKTKLQPYDGTFDLSRRDEPDTTLDTILEADTSTESHSPHNKSFLSQYDTSRTRNDSFGSRSSPRDHDEPRSSPKDQVTSRTSPIDREALRLSSKDQHGASKSSPKDQHRASPKDRGASWSSPKDQSILRNNLYGKLPDDNMNSETVLHGKDTGNSIGVVPTLEPNG